LNEVGREKWRDCPAETAAAENVVNFAAPDQRLMEIAAHVNTITNGDPISKDSSGFLRSRGAGGREAGAR
jgi:hypothetical protein